MRSVHHNAISHRPANFRNPKHEEEGPSGTGKPPPEARAQRWEYFRKKTRLLLASKAADRTVLLVIVLNTITIALETPGTLPNATAQNVLNVAETVFTVFFTVEMLLKMFGYRLFVKPRGYFRRGWNVLDFVCVTSSYLSFIPGVGSFTMVRLVRVLRPLRSISRIKGMRTLINTLLYSIPMMGSVLVLLFFLLCTFSIVGLQLWQGEVHQRCYATGPNSTLVLDSAHADRPCSTGNFGNQCPAPLQCNVDLKQFRETTWTFDNILSALLLTFKVISTDDWNTEMYYTQSYAGYAAFLFYVILTILGSLFCVNFMLAVQWMVFEAEVKKEESRPRSRPQSVELNAESFTLPVGDGAWQLFRAKVLVAAQSMVLEYSMFVVTIVNVVALSSDFYQAPDWVRFAISKVNLVCTIVFTAEATIKIVGLGPRLYFFNLWHMLDFLLVVSGLVDFIFPGARVLSAFRAFRVKRFLNLFRHWVAMRVVLMTLSRALRKVICLAVIMALLLFVYCLVGMQFFTTAFPASSRATFRTLWEGYLTCFVIITGDGWTSTMQVAMEATNPAAALYFITLFSFGQYMIVNLFIAILIEKFEQVQDEVMNGTEPSEAIVNKLRNLLGNTRSRSLAPKTDIQVMQFADFTNEYGITALTNAVLEDPEDNPLMPTPPSSEAPSQRSTLLRDVVHHPVFDKVVIGLIFANLVVVALDYPAASPLIAEIVSVGNIVFTVVFIIELMVKLFLEGPAQYLRNGWNVMDAAVIVVCALALLFPTVRGLNSLRILRVMVQVRSLRIVLVALARSFSGIVGVLVVLLLIFLIFAILGLSFFCGEFYSCTDGTSQTTADCLKNNQTWKRTHYGFDNIGMSWLALLEVSIGSGWSNIMYMGIDSVGEGQAPVVNYNPPMALFFVSFFILATFVSINMFISVLISNFARLQRDLAGAKSLTPEQQKWVRCLRLVSRIQLAPKRRPETCYSPRMYDIVTNKRFEKIVYCAIIINMIFISLEHYQQPAWLGTMLRSANYVFVSLFTLEMIAKVAALNPLGYLKVGWNRFDCVILILSWVGIVAEVISTHSLSAVYVARAFRIGRVLRLIKRAELLKQLIAGIVYAGPALANVGAIVLAVYFVFGVWGVRLFGSLKHTPPLDDTMNFNNLGAACLSLYQISTTLTWNDVMYAATIAPPLCDESKDECGSFWAYLYFPAFIMAGAFVVLNMFLTIVLDQFTEAEFKRDMAVLKELWAMWIMHDKLITKKLPAKTFIEIFTALPPPLGPGGKASKFRTLHLLASLNIPIDENHEVRFEDVVNNVTRRVFHLQPEEATLVLNIVKANRRGRLRGRQRRKTSRAYIPEDNVFRVHHLYAASLLIDCLRQARKNRLEGPSPPAEPQVPVTRSHSSIRHSLRSLRNSIRQTFSETFSVGTRSREGSLPKSAAPKIVAEMEIQTELSLPAQLPAPKADAQPPILFNFPPPKTMVNPLGPAPPELRNQPFFPITASPKALPADDGHSQRLPGYRSNPLGRLDGHQNSSFASPERGQDYFPSWHSGDVAPHVNDYSWPTARHTSSSSARSSPRVTSSQAHSPSLYPLRPSSLATSSDTSSSHRSSTTQGHQFGVAAFGQRAQMPPVPLTERGAAWLRKQGYGPQPGDNSNLDDLFPFPAYSGLSWPLMALLEDSPDPVHHPRQQAYHESQVPLSPRAPLPSRSPSPPPLILGAATSLPPTPPEFDAPDSDVLEDPYDADEDAEDTNSEHFVAPSPQPLQPLRSLH
eukprot:TRINITY_DN10227_c0_g1_i2.p1 TRINITY_DN10227_c0_g1~~TRINITY_DN10227_c0_g1_i2.p1  ORF type:complete len:1748 (-),score=254.68 TRINITY_DN10227_c0_g1_i2:23-5266(-)